MRKSPLTVGDRIRRLSNLGPLRGHVVVGNEICVLRRWSSVIEMYRMQGGANRLQPTQTIPIASLQRPDDLAFDRTQNVLYVLGWVSSNEQVVIAIDKQNATEVCRWPVVMRPYRLCADNLLKGSILIACRDGLRLYSSAGECNVQVPFHSTVRSPWHAVPLLASPPVTDDNLPSRYISLILKVSNTLVTRDHMRH